MKKLPSFLVLLAFLGLAFSANALTVPIPIVSRSYFDKIRIRYPSVSGAVKYNIYRGTTNQYYSSVMIDSTTKTSYNDKSKKALSGDTFYYWVCPVAADGVEWYNESKYSAGWRLLENSHKGLVAPEPTCTTNKTSYVQVSYSKVTGAKAYGIVRSETMYFDDGSQIAWNVTGTSYQDKSAVAGKTYYYWVCPIDQSGDAWGDGCKFAKGKRAKSSSKKLKAPQALGSVSYSSYVRIRYGSVSGAKKYNIYRLQEDSADDEWTDAQLTAFYKKAKKIGSTTGTSYKDKTAKKGKQYYYWVHPVDKNGKSYGNKIRYDYGWLKEKGELAPPTPKATTNNKSYIKVTWKKVSGAKSYMLCRCDTLNIYEEDIEWIPVYDSTGTSFKDKTAKAGKNYYYWVFVKDKNGFTWSDNSRFVKGKRKK